jgi:hypothetical protein
MPAEGVREMSHRDILSYEEIYTVVRAASELGINKVRLTGGEPLVRLGIPKLVAMLEQIEAIDDISLTTNGTLLGRYAAELKRSGLKRVNISLDTALTMTKSSTLLVRPLAKAGTCVSSSSCPPPGWVMPPYILSRLTVSKSSWQS